MRLRQSILASVASGLLLLLTPTLSYTALSDASLRALSIPEGTFDIHDKSRSLLAPILVPRVSGTDGNKAVQGWFLDFFAQQLPTWNVTTQTSLQKTPATGDRDVPFTNIVATRSPPWAGAGAGDTTSYLTLVAHFDSKRTPDGFIGATDSAAPCAMILHAARELEGALTKKWADMQAKGDHLDDFLDGPQGLQILLLDGEEAMVSWTHTDSLYGARALAEEWEKPLSNVGAMGDGRPNKLGAISLFVLLDLLGAPQPKVPSYFRTTHWAYQAMARVEEKLRDLKVSTSKVSNPFLTDAKKTVNDANAQWLGGHIEDDHLPFMARGVEVLHLITNPFPSVWHTMGDDGEHLDIPTVEDWARVITGFTAEWMDLEGFLTKASSKRDAMPDEKSEL